LSKGFQKVHKKVFAKSNRLLCTYPAVAFCLPVFSFARADSFILQTGVGASYALTAINLKVGDVDFSTKSASGAAINIDVLLHKIFLAEFNYTAAFGQSSLLLQGLGAHASWIFWGDERRFRQTPDASYELSNNFAARLGLGLAYLRYDLSNTVSEVTIANETSNKDFLIGSVAVPEALLGLSYGLWGPWSMNAVIKGSMPTNNPSLNLTIQVTSVSVGLKYTF
jgi:hypothetical protein